jgi:hypothetical protein
MTEFTAVTPWRQLDWALVQADGAACAVAHGYRDTYLLFHLDGKPALTKWVRRATEPPPWHTVRTAIPATLTLEATVTDTDAAMLAEAYENGVSIQGGASGGSRSWFIPGAEHDLYPSEAIGVAYLSRGERPPPRSPRYHPPADAGPVQELRVHPPAGTA